MATTISTHYKRFTLVATAIIILSLIGAGLVGRHKITDWYRALSAEPVPTAVSFNEVSVTTDEVNNVNTHLTVATPEINTETETDAAEENVEEEKAEEMIVTPPAELNLDIPFTSQAPHANWGLPYQEACEEASILMSARFLQGRGIAGPDDANAAIVELVNYNVEELGQPIDTTAEQTANIIENFYDLKTEVLYDWTWDDVKEALTQGYPVILPAAGRQLGNPNFTAPGPIYHMVVVKGYTKNIIITNDPGTRKGADYQYSYDTLTTANHDWNNGDVPNGEKVIIIVKPNYEN